MKHLWRFALCAGLVLVIAAQARAQYGINPFPVYNPGPRQAGGMARGPNITIPNRPQLSPYLNMLRGGSPAANYYLGVIPEQNRRAIDAQLQSAFQQIDQQLANQGTTGAVEDLFPPLSQTGHPVTFLNPSPYLQVGTGVRNSVPPSNAITPPKRRK